MQSNINSFASTESDETPTAESNEIPTRPEDVVAASNSSGKEREVPVNKQSTEKIKEKPTKDQDKMGVVYVRVSSAQQLGNLEDQAARVTQFRPERILS